MYARALNYSCQEVGKTIKSSKRKYVWDFDFEMNEDESEKHQVMLCYSVVSGKRQIYLDGTKISSSVGQYGSLQMKFEIDKYKNVAVIQNDVDNKDKYTLYINNVKFKDLYSVKNKDILYQNKKKKNDQLIDEYCLSNDDQDDENTQNYIDLVEQRHQNVASKEKGNNPQIFKGPIIQPKINQNNQNIPVQRGDRFNSFGFDSFQKDQNNQLSQQQNSQSTSMKNQINTSNPNQQNQYKKDNCPFFGQNFDSWVTTKQTSTSPQKEQSNKIQATSEVNKKEDIFSTQDSQYKSNQSYDHMQNHGISFGIDNIFNQVAQPQKQQTYNWLLEDPQTNQKQGNQNQFDLLEM